MKSVFVSAALTALVLAMPASPANAQDANADVLKVVTNLFDGMRKKDTTLMRAQFAPGARLVSAAANQNGVNTLQEMTIDAWISSVGRSTSALDEKIFAPEVRVDGNLATVWTKYELWVNNAFRHCGFDAFQLGKTPAGWKIFSVADSRRTEGCR